MTGWKDRFRPTAGTGIALVALFLAIGGVGYAAGKIDTNDIKDGAVTKPKIADEAVNSERIQDETIKYKDLKFDPDSLVGPQGPQGAQGPEGPQGPAGPANVDVDKTASIATAQAAPSLENGAIVPLSVNEGFAWAALCQAGPSGTPGTGALLVVQNLSGGDNAHVNGALTFLDANASPTTDQTDDFDQGEVAVVANSFSDNVMSRAGYPQATSQGGYGAAFANTLRGGGVLIYAANGSTQLGMGGAIRNPTGFQNSPACSVSLNMLAK
jgi:hypothetical protein